MLFCTDRDELKKMPKIIKDIEEWYYPLSNNDKTKEHI